MKAFLRPATIVSLVGSLIGSTPLLAHHSYAAFDRDTQITLSGVVREFQWNNPHTWIQVIVVDEQGRMKEWGIEAASPNMLARTGWKSTTLKAGDRIVAVVNPLKDGRPNASLVKITLADGRVLGPGNAPAPLPLGAARSKS